VSGWWTALTTDRNIGRTAPPSDQVEEGGRYVIPATSSRRGRPAAYRFGLRIQNPTEFAAGETLTMRLGASLTVAEDGSYECFRRTRRSRAHTRPAHVLYAALPPRFTSTTTQRPDRRGHRPVVHQLASRSRSRDRHPDPDRGLRRLCAGLDAFPGRALIAAIIGLLVVPLQMSLIPLLRLYNGVGRFFGVPAKTYLGIWLAHTGFGLPLAIYLLRNYMASLPQEIMESARIDGASDFEIFTAMVLPLSVPALAAFSIFQFLWVWNDLLVAMVFLGNRTTSWC
jgi:alpha-glucoside transport system permease protein